MEEKPEKDDIAKAFDSIMRDFKEEKEDEESSEKVDKDFDPEVEIKIITGKFSEAKKHTDLPEGTMNEIMEKIKEKLGDGFKSHKLTEKYLGETIAVLLIKPTKPLSEYQVSLIVGT